MPKPLAERVRPRKIDDIIGQVHLLGREAVLRKAIENENIPSMVLWGPPGVGKTTIARVISEAVGLPFYSLSAIASGVKDVRKVIELAKHQGKAIVFIDEIHRFNKSQQDALLGAVEEGLIILIGATTENPSFEVNAALLSRTQVYVLKPLDPEQLKELVKKAIREDSLLSQKEIEVKEWDSLFRLSGGDARRILNVVELIVSQQGEENRIEIDNKMASEAVQQKMAMYDKTGEQHYDIISAFIKSMRGSDPNAAVYYLARMLEGGEDPKFIARRMIILASEDIGNANPTALVIANNCFQSINVIGMPEARIILSQTAIYLASSAKSNASYEAINKAMSKVKKTGDLPVPLALRNAPTKLMKEQGYGAEYKYSHSFPGNFIEQEFMPEGLTGEVFYEPGKNKREEQMRQQLRQWWRKKYAY